MLIRHLFEKNIERDIKGVINVGQDDDANIVQELEEYVVTRELQRHFRDFFNAYTKSIGGIHEEMGVWVSGFFGSGKSHFLKILSYLLDHRPVEGRDAAAYFEEGRKIGDAAVMANINRAGTVPADVMLFNIGAKADTSSQAGKDTITSVFLKVFNEKTGYCGAMPFLAEFERMLDAEGRYAAFQDMFKEVSGKDWVSHRDDYYFIQDELVETIVRMGLMSEAAARSWSETRALNYEMSTENFAKLVKQHCDSRGKDHHVVFLVDEVGQYISSDSQLMLNLQNITEDLGRICRGKAWVVVTSQMDMGKSIEGVKDFRSAKNDFSRIQDRFKTRLQLSSASVDEVIRKRILQKKEAAAAELALYYDQKKVVLSNLTHFVNSAEMKLPRSREDFAQVYPLVPYQFDLMGWVLTAIRENASVGLNLAHGERSMLALFKAAAQARADEETGALIPLNQFYSSLVQFINTAHTGVISKAGDVEALEDFDVEILKVLLMVKYIKEVPASVENLTSLMVSSVDEDRLALKRRIEEGLPRLIRQTLIAKSGDNYAFLTNEEQDINRAIAREGVEGGEVARFVAETVFDGIYLSKKYSYSARYNFPFNQIVDSLYYKGGPGDDMGIRILTAYEEADDNSLRMRSSQEKNALVQLPRDAVFMEDITNAIRISKYLQKNTLSLRQTHPMIQAAKSQELQALKGRIRTHLEDAIRHADIYVQGSRMDIRPSAPADRLNSALSTLTAYIYHSLDKVKYPALMKDIEDILTPGNQITAVVDDPALRNAPAQDDLLTTLELNSQRHLKTTMKMLLDKYSKPPYGYVDLDVQWLAAALFKRGKAQLALSGEYLSLQTTPRMQLIQALTRAEYKDKLVLEPRVEVPPAHLQAAGSIIRELFGASAIPQDEDRMMQLFSQESQKLKGTLDKLLSREYYRQPGYPGKAHVDKGLKQLANAGQYKKAAAFFADLFEKQDEYLYLADSLRPLLAFFHGEQAAIFDKALRRRELFEQSRNYITDQQMIGVMKKISDILNQPEPYGQIYQLPPLLQGYEEMHVALMETESGPVIQAVREDKDFVEKALLVSPTLQQFHEPMMRDFDRLINKVEQGRSVAEILNARHESNALKVNSLNRIAEAEEKLKQPPSVPGGQPEGIRATKVKSPRVKNISAKQLLPNHDRLETEEDVDQYIESFKERLLEALHGQDAIRIIP